MTTRFAPLLGLSIVSRNPRSYRRLTRSEVQFRVRDRAVRRANVTSSHACPLAAATHHRLSPASPYIFLCLPHIIRRRDLVQLWIAPLSRIRLPFPGSHPPCSF